MLDQETLDQLLDTIRRFVRERLVPNEERIAEEDAIPPEIVSEMRELGLFGLSIPEEYGGIGLAMSEEVQVAFELGETSPSPPTARHATARRARSVAAARRWRKRSATSAQSAPGRSRSPTA